MTPQEHTLWRNIETTARAALVGWDQAEARRALGEAVGAMEEWRASSPPPAVDWAEVGPPEGTPEGTVCMLVTPRNHGGEKLEWRHSLFVWCRNWRGVWRWNGVWPEQGMSSPRALMLKGWRFHSIAEVPHD